MACIGTYGGVWGIYWDTGHREHQNQQEIEPQAHISDQGDHIGPL